MSKIYRFNFMHENCIEIEIILFLLSTLIAHSYLKIRYFILKRPNIYN